MPTYDTTSVLFHLKRWKETYALSFELAETTFVVLDAVIDYCKSHNIPINEDKGLWNLVVKARSILKEIEEVNTLNSRAQKVISDESKHLRKSDEDVQSPSSS